MQTPLVDTSDLTKTYGQVAALTRCNLQIDAGEVYGLLGPNGAGKTTLIRLLMGFLKPTSGSASIDGWDCYRQSVKVHTLVGYLPGEPRLFRRMTGRNVLRFFSRMHPGGDENCAIEIADKLGLDLTRKVAQCSTGMRQKLAIASVLSLDAPLYILDEPTSNLDPTVRQTLLNLIRDKRAQGRSVVFSSHVLAESEQVCDRVALLKNGQLVHVQSIKELRKQHRIRATVNGDVPPVPDNLRPSLHVIHENGTLTVQATGELSNVLGWLASIPLQELQIEPGGLKSVYERFHGERKS